MPATDESNVDNQTQRSRRSVGRRGRSLCVSGMEGQPEETLSEEAHGDLQCCEAERVEETGFVLEVTVHDGREVAEGVRATRVPKAPPATSEATRRSMQGNRSTNTKPELVVRRYLREAGLRGYRVQWRVAKGLGKPDVAFPGRRVAIFVHGCFWHRCPYCHPSQPQSNVEFWEAKFRRNRERDERDQQALLAAGWTVIVVWECRLKKRRLRRTMEAIVTEVRLTKPVRTRAEERPGKLIVLGLTHVRGPRGLAVKRVRRKRGGF